MSRFAVDLHMHSCLSPCADDDMTPYSMAGMAKLNGLAIAALTDHNACGNCESFFQACRGYGIVPVAGMELTTSEDVHLLCLFRTLESALAFAGEVENMRIRIPNRAEIFGKQLLIGFDDEPTGQEPDLLINATMLSLEEAARLVWNHNGAAVPAHVDREGNGVIAVLGDLPESPVFASVEYRDEANVPAYEAQVPRLIGKRRIVSSDAHRLWEIASPGCPLELNCPDDAKEQEVRDALIDYLLGK
ncbi:MAG TPA: PHP domain-containing protein [Feifaniaceae bacterium]|nr:PHP domain-containing protein [Feifaniaceae bacterium]